jgi:diacylglycerol kinase family enzyme
MRYRRALVVKNPKSGRGHGGTLGAEVSRQLAAMGVEAREITVGEDADLGGALGEAMREGCDVVVIVGGDGTLRSCLRPLTGSNVPVLLVPTGTGNLIATHLKIPTRAKPLARLLVEGIERRVDVATIDGEPFILAAGFGLATDVIRDADTEMKRYLGPLAYLWSLIRNLARRRVLVELKLDDGTVVSHRAKMVLFANCAETLGQVDIVPNAAMDDGLVDVAVFHYADFWQFIRLVGYLLTARWRRAREAVFYRARSVEVWVRPPMPVQIDGDVFEARSYFRIGIEPASLSILTPGRRAPLMPREWLSEAEKQLERLRTGSSQAPAEILRAFWEEHVAPTLRPRHDRDPAHPQGDDPTSDPPGERTR